MHSGTTYHDHPSVFEIFNNFHSGSMKCWETMGSLDDLQKHITKRVTLHNIYQQWFIEAWSQPYKQMFKCMDKMPNLLSLPVVDLMFSSEFFFICRYMYLFLLLFCFIHLVSLDLQNQVWQWQVFMEDFHNRNRT